MALKQLMITKKIADLEAERTQLNGEIAKTLERRNAWTAREAQAEEAFRELNENSTAEERTAVENEAAALETEDGEIRADEERQTTRSGEIENEINKLKDELEDINKRAKTPPQSSAHASSTKTTERGDNSMNFKNHTPEFRERVRECASRAETKEFFTELRVIYRGVSNAKLTVPTAMLPLIREVIDANSKLTKHLNHKLVKGEGRQNILADTPEAVWTEMPGAINELTFGVNQIKVDGFKVAGFVPIENWLLEDSDEDLAGIVIDTLGKSIALAKDKAVIYGDGNGRPVGILSRLTAAAQPTWWQTNMPAFTNISTTHVLKQSATTVKDQALLTEALTALAAAENKYDGTTGDLFWAMSSATWKKLKIMTMNFNASGAIVAGMDGQLPIIGGDVEELDFIPEGHIIGGYGNHYLDVERAGMQIAKSDAPKFVEDQTLFKATARYDGMPVCGEAFAAFSLNQTAVTASAVTFPEDKANAAAASET